MKELIFPSLIVLFLVGGLSNNQNRYQITAQREEGVFVLDTTTGEVWHKGCGKSEYFAPMEYFYKQHENIPKEEDLPFGSESKYTPEETRRRDNMSWGSWYKSIFLSVL